MQSLNVSSWRTSLSNIFTIEFIAKIFNSKQSSNFPGDLCYRCTHFLRSYNFLNGKSAAPVKHYTHSGVYAAKIKQASIIALETIFHKLLHAQFFIFILTASCIGSNENSILQLTYTLQLASILEQRVSGALQLAAIQGHFRFVAVL